MKAWFGLNTRLEPRTPWDVEGMEILPGTNPGPGFIGIRVEEGFTANVPRVTVAGACVAADAAVGCAVLAWDPCAVLP
jgi:hypothetical protein